MAIKLVLDLKEGLDTPVQIWQSNRTRLFTVYCGAHIKRGLTYGEASKEFGECVFHSLACKGTLDNG